MGCFLTHSPSDAEGAPKRAAGARRGQRDFDAPW